MCVTLFFVDQMMEMEGSNPITVTTNGGTVITYNRDDDYRKRVMHRGKII